jgi:hypothetical protein
LPVLAAPAANGFEVAVPPLAGAAGAGAGLLSIADGTASRARIRRRQITINTRRTDTRRSYLWLKETCTFNTFS